MILYLFDVLLFCYMIGNGACEKSRRYATPNFGLPEQKVALHVGVHFYIDKELMVIVVLLFSYHCLFYVLKNDMQGKEIGYSKYFFDFKKEIGI